MKRRNEFILGIAAVLLLSSFPGYGAFNEGCAEDLASWVTEAPVKEEKETAASSEKKEEETREACEDAEDEEFTGEVYTFDGKKYVIDKDWGCHYLTGFSPNADGSRRTASGVDATSGYTVSSTKANLGKVILIKAEKGSSAYDGFYKCQDTGGQAVEYGQANTMNVPVVDIFFDTEEEADLVTDAGWITARVYILKEVK